MKTEYARDRMPLDPVLADVLLRHRARAIKRRSSGCSRILRRSGRTTKTASNRSTSALQD